MGQIITIIGGLTIVFGALNCLYISDTANPKEQAKKCFIQIGVGVFITLVGVLFTKFV